MNMKNNIGTGIPSNKETKKDITVRYFYIFGIPIIKTTLPKNQIDDLNKISDEVLTSPDKVDHSEKLAGVIKKGQQLLLPHKHNKDPEKDRTLKILRSNIKALCSNYIKSVRNSDEGSKKFWKSPCSRSGFSIDGFV